MSWSTAAAGAGIGLIAGSFVATLALRWPQERSLGGRSTCDGCAATLRWFELVPVLSFLVSRARCRRCGAPIDATHAVGEILCAIVGAVAIGISPDVAGIVAALAGWLLMALAMLDVRHFWLPDVLTGTLAIIAAVGAFAGVDPPPLDRLIGGFAGFAVLWAVAFVYRTLRYREGLGGGDPKLFGAIGLWLGWQALPFVLLLASLAGLAVAAIMMGRGKAIGAATRLPLGALLAGSAFAWWTATRLA